MSGPTTTFRYRAVTAQGAEVSDVIVAVDRREALSRLVGDGLSVTHIEPVAGPAASLSFLNRQGVGPAERILILRQLALMSRAGADLLDALETVADGMGGETGVQLRQVATGLRRGERLSQSFESGMPSFPRYVYALVEVGEASGKLDRVLEDAASQLMFEDRIRRDITSALTYPAFLVAAGAAAVGFLFFEVVPRFAAMIGSNRENITGLAAFVLNTGEAFRANALWVLAVAVVLGGAAASALQTANGKRVLYDWARRAPAVSSLMIANERATWARIMSFALANGVGLLEAGDLAGGSAPEGAFRRGLMNATRAIRAGKRVDEAFAEPGLLARIDVSLLRAGQKSGSLASTFGFIAERYEEDLRDALKRVTALIEPLAILFVALAVGAVAIGLVTAMSSVYDAVL